MAQQHTAPHTPGAPLRTIMADGRELIYFFDTFQAPTGFTPPSDTRELPPRPPVSELRYDALSGDWISFAAHRQARTHLPAASECPLCPTRAEQPSEIPAPDYDVVVFENRFPSFGPEQHSSDTSAVLGAKRPSHGRCEVITFGPGHTDSLASLGPTRIRTVIDAWAQRTAELGALPGIEQVFPFENRGAEIGVTLHHPHGQIYSYPYVTPRTENQLARAAEHRSRTGTNLMADVLDFELTDGSRIIERGTYFTAFVPYAAHMPIEVLLVPNRQVATLDELTNDERDELATMYHRLLCTIDALYPTPTPYIAGWFQAPANHPQRDEAWLHLQLTSPRRAADKMKYLAGSEAVMGAFIGDVTPESSAAALRAAAARIAANPTGTAPTHSISTSTPAEQSTTA
ncbi:galactose-1-phosphate uridylyltransferase [Arthrobacter sp. MYb227]|uniref:galactose-1-phosphate uridylyltransferase n=1 Tax=Arthrobacter sp. MYb227 TaxID=1848601 RepID=UPI000CFDE742|nr:galactose-1-phosphate uridylyltransferase [Arthrobacter sp. MYb227]PQZ95114.1 galactose-1-phosphate uridylyltransferase [Arthrobacter sp. MYb227]